MMEVFKKIILMLVLTFTFLFIASTSNASEKIFRCEDSYTTRDYTYYKIKSSTFFGDKLFERRDGQWIESCKIGNDCRNCSLNITEDSFICKFHNVVKGNRSHKVIDMITMTQTWFSYDEKGGTYYEPPTEKCSFVKR